MTDQCSVCGDKVGPHNEGQDVCPGCHYDTYIPNWYQDEEQYEYIAAFAHRNASKSPSLGVPFLDAHVSRIADIATSPVALRHLQQQERSAM